ncbi:MULTISPECIES: methyltransferase domain-containing protein [Cyanophyceae]|uniref:methyltransferase domain-containing protein n=1 Tax=Cyanophyceae TaxID=3028117 RepID=UPI001681F457|nr:methyltransferase domain-containing protein [Trichocoleus sp. FACHB-40]MBD2002381.1 methyltransferase domain-containing protein [Trichocoleus sp. FACHB-40]
MKILTKLRFHFKNGLYRLTPGGYGYYRKLRRYNDSEYDHERDKHPVRSKHYAKEGWKQEKQEGLTYRDYENYDEYITHQKQKFEEIIKITGGFSNQVIWEWRLKFYRRFRLLTQILPNTACIVCAGARQGTEVEVLRDLGFRNAYGIDLNPGSENPLVKIGDFLHMDNATSSVDLIYTNCVDHAWNLEELFSEHARVIKQDGYVLYDLSMDMKDGGGPFEAVAWESEEELFLIMLRYFKTVVRVEVDGSWKWILLQGKREGKPVLSS